MFGVFTVLVALVVCGSSATERTLVLIDSYAAKETYSQFYDLLAGNGHSLTFRLVDDASLALSKYGDYLYENVMVMSNNVEEFGGELDAAKLVEFVDRAAGNVFVATDSNVGSAVREFLLECGIELDERSKVEDYFRGYDKPLAGDSQHDGSVLKVAPDNFLRSETIVGRPERDVLYRGSALTIDTDNPLVYPVLRVPKTAFARSGHAVAAPGPDRMLMAAVQARNNARIFASASLDFFSDRFFTAADNRNVAETLALWTFQQRGVIRTRLIRHYQPEFGQAPPAHNYYTVGDPVVYEIAIEQKQAPGRSSNATSSWTPFALADQLQLEFVRIDPFVRITLAYDANAQLYRGRFRIPDVYGVYKFKVFYARVGWSFLHSETQVSVRPLRHTQYERFILNAYPYYASAFSMMGSLFLFILFYLYADFAPNAPHPSDKKQK